MHPHVAAQLNQILDGVRLLSDWITFGKTVLCQRDPAKESPVDNYRPISCLPLMWRLMTGMLAEEMYSYLEREKVLSSEQKGCCKGSCGTKDQLLIHKTVLRDCKKRHANLAMVWIDYKKAYDMVSHSWISECLQMFGIASSGQNFLNNNIKS